MSLHQANKDKPRAQKCRHFCFSFDNHNYCPTCREAGKGDDPCVTFEAPCHICTSLSDEQLQKIQNRKRYLKKQKAETSSKDELDLLGEGDGDSFTGSNADLESAADNLFTSPPRPQPLAFSSLSLKTPAKAVPPTPGTVLQNKIQRNLEKSLGDSLNIHFIALIHPIQWTIALPVGTTGPAKRQKKTSCIYYRQDRSQSVHSPGGASYFISCLPIDVIASFSFGAKECAEDFLRRYVFEVLQRTLPSFLFFLLVRSNSTTFLIIMSSPGQKRGSCGHVMALFDNHKKCARCRDKGVGDDPCVKKLDCSICKAFTPAQIHQLATPTYKERKERSSQKKSEELTSTSPKLVDPSEVSLLGPVNSGTQSPVDSTPKQKKKRSDDSPRSSKRKHSSKPTSDDLKSLDDKWSERFSRLEAMLINQSFAVPVRPVNSASVVPREHPFFDPGASTSVMFSEGTSDVATQLMATQPPLGVPGTQAVKEVTESATHPVQGPGTSETVATQPLLVPGAGTATQPPQAPGAGPEVLPSGYETTLSNQSPPIGQNSEVTRESDSEAEVDAEPASPASVHYQGDVPETNTDQDLSEDANYRETLRGVRSFMGWHQIPDYDTSAASMDDNPFAGSRVKTTGKVSVKLPVDEWLCKKLEKLNITIAEGYPSRNTETSGLLRDQFVKTPRTSKWHDMQAVKKDASNQAVGDWSPEPAKLNSMFSRVARRSLPSAPASRTFSQDTLRRWERSFREQSVMCNHAAGLSRCLTKVQDSMVTQLKSLRFDSSKGKSAEKQQQAVEELEYLVTFNRSISQAMQRTMQDLSEGVFISMANLTLARRDSYLEFIRGGIKPDTLSALRTSPVHQLSLFPDSLLVKAEEEILRSEERRSAGTTPRKPGRFHPYVSSNRTPHQPDRKPTTPAWKQIRDRQTAQKGGGKASNFSQKPARGFKKHK